MTYRFYRIAPIDETTPDPINNYLQKMEIGSDHSEESMQRLNAEKEKYRNRAFVKYAKAQKWGNHTVYGFIETLHPFPVNCFGGDGWSEMVVVLE